ncbi:NAD(P)-dependent oxidoreductase, partial [Vibrio kanaloae]
RPSNSRLSTEKITQGFSIEASDWNAALNNIQAYTEQ